MGNLGGAPTGILALWNDCAEGQLEAYEHWYKSEHMIERLGIPGFRTGRRYEAIEAPQRFFTYYEVDEPDVLTSPAYLERVNNPTPLTRKIMSGIFTNLSRTICTRVGAAGRPTGGYAVTAKLDAPADDAALERLSNLRGCVRAESWQAADVAEQPKSREEQIRGGDTRIEACLLVHALREEDTQVLSREISATMQNILEISTYRLLCELRETESGL